MLLITRLHCGIGKPYNDNIALRNKWLIEHLIYAKGLMLRIQMLTFSKHNKAGHTYYPYLIEEETEA